MGVFIVFEGGEGSGKSTQARALYQRLLLEGYPSLVLHEPGGTPLGEQVRRLLKSQQGGSERATKSRGHPVIGPVAELLLFSASRIQLVENVLRPALNEGRVVVCDRFTPSTVAYQGHGRGVSLETIEALNGLTTQDVEMDQVVLLDIAPEEGLRRVNAQVPMALGGGNAESVRLDEEGYRRFEEEPLSFHRKVRQSYLRMAKEDPDRWLMVNASLPQEEISETIWQRVEPIVRDRLKLA